MKSASPITNYQLPNYRPNGFALVVTIILSTVMLTVVTLASKEMVDEMKNSARLDNSLIAYYAAEAGIEDALLQYRYNKNIEIAEECVEVSFHKILTDPEASTKCAPNAFGKTHYYKLKMSNKTTGTTVKVYKDDTYEISIPPTNTNSTFSITWTNSVSGIRLEAVSYSSDGKIIEKKFTAPDSTSTGLNIAATPGIARIIRIKPWYSANNDAYITLNLPANTNSGTTTIESTGYYGNVARKIVAKLDSTSGSILNVFDYTIYSDTALAK